MCAFVSVESLSPLSCLDAIWHRRFLLERIRMPVLDLDRNILSFGSVGTREDNLVGMSRLVLLIVVLFALSSPWRASSFHVRAKRPLRFNGPLGVSQSEIKTGTDSRGALLETGQKILGVLSKAAQYTASDPLRFRYAAATAARFGFFLTQGIGISLSGIDQKARESQNGINAQSVIGALSDAILAADDANSDEAPEMEIEKSVAAKVVLDDDEQRALFDKNFQAIVKVLRSDLANIESGAYKFPYDLQFLGEGDSSSNNLLNRRQWNPAAVLAQAATYIQDRQSVFERRDRKDGRDSFRNFKSSKYPDYYLQNFHYQTDGWLSAKSARLYDYQVESLFIGTADAMRRQVLPFFTKWVKEKQTQGVDPRVLDVATGTGRFASFMMANCRSLDLDVLDLSPFYLAEAKRLLNQYDSVSYVEAAAETTGLPDASYDAITCVYLFHELPGEVRKAVLKEWMRILKPGGKVFFVDSAQEGEVPYDRVLEGFTVIAHEPYYLDYTRTDLSKIFNDAGFQVDTTEVHWVSKLLCATKPGGSDDDDDSVGAEIEIEPVAAQEEGVGN